MSNRDDFSKKTKNAVAARAGWHCSFTGCGKSTVGPSEESSDAVTMIGKAAHICGAVPGPGSRQYPQLVAELGPRVMCQPSTNSPKCVRSFCAMLGTGTTWRASQ